MSLTTRLRAFKKAQNETLDIDRLDVQLPLLPPALRGYRIAVLSDLHMPHHEWPFLDDILQAMRDIHPECIFIAGDTIDAESGPIAPMEGFFAALCGIAPTIAALGNNDCLRSRIASLRTMYRRAGVLLLEDETMPLHTARGVPIKVTSAIDPCAYKNHIAPAQSVRHYSRPPLWRSVPPQKMEGALAPSILILHRPELATQYAPLQPSLIVSGHAHGGQIRLPGIGGLYAPGQGIFPRLTSGLYTIDGIPLLVSRGIGNHHFPLRINNRPHLPVIALC